MGEIFQNSDLQSIVDFIQKSKINFECFQLAKDAALKHPHNRSIGCDIVVTVDGPGLIEGNHDWCKLVWQLPVNQGLKSLLKSNYV